MVEGAVVVVRPGPGHRRAWRPAASSATAAASPASSPRPGSTPSPASPCPCSPTPSTARPSRWRRPVCGWSTSPCGRRRATRPPDPAASASAVASPASGGSPTSPARWTAVHVRPHRADPLAEPLHLRALDDRTLRSPGLRATGRRGERLVFEFADGGCVRSAARGRRSDVIPSSCSERRSQARDGSLRALRCARRCRDGG